MKDSPTRAGFVAIIGLPNVGKSTLLNRFLGSKLSIVTSAAQTTRERVVGIDTRDDTQFVFMDTPGLVEPAYLLHHSMLDAVSRAIDDADVVVLLVDGTRPAPSIDEELAARLRTMGGAFLVAITKVDAARSANVNALTEWARRQFQAEVMTVSAESGSGVDELRTAIAAWLPASPFLYPEDDLSTQTVRFFVSELVRESIFERFEQEIPFSSVVKVEELREDDDPILIRATVFVERPSQKGILIGKGGSAIRDLGTASRAKIEEFLGRRVYLELRVKVLPKWRKNPLELTRLGFQLPPDESSPDA
jgi:GTP-binding protein Era